MKYFIKNIEDFTCEHCNTQVKGSGYTNHCTECLWSKHVDLFPGDRLSRCQGMMEPIAIENEGDVYYIKHLCTLCGFDKRNKVLPTDNFDSVAAIAKKRALKANE